MFSYILTLLFSSSKPSNSTGEKTNNRKKLGEGPQGKGAFRGEGAGGGARALYITCQKTISLIANGGVVRRLAVIVLGVFRPQALEVLAGL